jgi:hypothetical protein
MKTNYRLIVTPFEGKRVKLAGNKCHDTKSVAGRLFQLKSVKSVFVADTDGNHYLYLTKDKNGEVIQSKTENVRSSEAVYG